jgi:Kef-type K+ transport system membrane component KefB
MNNVDLAILFFFQLAIILTACRIVGLLAARLGQPQVVAEMITGVLLGPSFFGLFWPEWQQWVFPWDAAQKTRDTQSYLFPASQLGLALYMFVVGMEFRVEVLKKYYVSSIAISVAGMLAPFILGMGLGWYCHEYTELFPPQTSLFEASVFLGAALSITAFPMLARIIHYKGLAGTRMGTVAIGAGAIDDASAWCMLAVVLASFDNDFWPALIRIGLAIVFILCTTLILKPILVRIEPYLVGEKGITDAGLTLALTCLVTGAWFTDLIGLHAVFGAFVMGSVMPRKGMTPSLIEKIQPLTVALLLPLFFTYSGLNTRISLLNSWSLWVVCGLVLLCAILGKGVACWLAARLTGLPNREAIGVGALMNARGLMELIIINIGLQRGVISPALYATLVVMAVVTTLMASPLFDLFVSQKVDTEKELQLTPNTNTQ